jgi:hypothetical protein
VFIEDRAPRNVAPFPAQPVTHYDGPITPWPWGSLFEDVESDSGHVFKAAIAFKPDLVVGRCKHDFLDGQCQVCIDLSKSTQKPPIEPKPEGLKRKFDREGYHIDLRSQWQPPREAVEDDEKEDENKRVRVELWLSNVDTKKRRKRSWWFSRFWRGPSLQWKPEERPKPIVVAGHVVTMYAPACHKNWCPRCREYLPIVHLVKDVECRV